MTSTAASHRHPASYSQVLQPDVRAADEEDVGPGLGIAPVAAMVAFRIRRRWWSRFSPLVRTGWILFRTDASAGRRRALLGVVVMALGLVLKPRRRTVLYSQVLRADDAVTVRIRRVGAS